MAAIEGVLVFVFDLVQGPTELCLVTAKNSSCHLFRSLFSQLRMSSGVRNYIERETLHRGDSACSFSFSKS